MPGLVPPLGAELLAQRFERAGTRLYTVAVPLARLADVLPIPDPDEPFTGNRRVSLRHATEFADYWLANRRWVAPPLLTDTPEVLDPWFEPISQSGGLIAGILRLPGPSASGLQILDGQHRTLGWHLLSGHVGEHHERLSAESVTVEILEGVGIEEHKQYFFDIAANAKGISKSLSAGFDKRAPIHRAARRLAEEHPLLAGRVDFENDRVAAKRFTLLSLQNVVDVVTAAVLGINGWVTTERARSLDDAAAHALGELFLDALVVGFDDLADVAEDQLTPSELRQSSLLGSVTMLRVLAGSFHVLAVQGEASRAGGDAEVRRVFALLAPHMQLPLSEFWWASNAFSSRDARAPLARRQDLTALVAFVGRVARQVPHEASRPAIPSPPPPTAPQTPAPQATVPRPPPSEPSPTDADDEPLPVLTTPGPTTDPVKDYLRAIGKVPLLTAAQEVALAKRIEAGLFARERLESGATTERRLRRELEWLVHDGRRATDHLLEANLRLVVSIAKRYSGYGMELLDIVQEGNLGLIRSVERFDHRLGYKFSTFATWWIRQSITRGIADRGRTIRLPVHVFENVRKVRAAQRAYTATRASLPSTAVLAAATDLDRTTVIDLLTWSAPLRSLDEPVAATVDEIPDATWDGTRWTIPLGHAIIDDLPDEGPDEVLFGNLLRADVRKVLDALGPRERGVIMLRFGLADGETRTLDEIGKVYGVTRERIRQIEKKTMEELRGSVLGDALRSALDIAPAPEVGDETS
ncbi:sigma-70 family RNA polymerase sigma factor [Cellulomonas sp. HZM]|uniref:sigma-70 family RNA polymerase sigma factor n=1 Tax=Cellulomonas sp. HZM TaxID=1454010 RepID=UPI0006925E1B|nr:sigma-70 family RNA polymerase sigma factor [Cellulomonas sp. HZM]